MASVSSIFFNKYLEVLSLACKLGKTSSTVFSDDLTRQLERLRRQGKMVFSIVGLFLLDA